MGFRRLIRQEKADIGERNCLFKGSGIEQPPPGFCLVGRLE